MMKKDSSEVLMSGKATFRVEVPYKLIETGKKTKKKPLFIYLHGFGQNIDRFEEVCKPMLSVVGYHLFIQGPYPLYDRSRKENVSKWGRAWYLYDGNRGQFIKSLEVTSEFIQEVTDRIIELINPSRICLVGYSMGGYLAGYFSLTRWKHVNELVVIGARIKTEVLNEHWDNIKHLNILALHGKHDDSVLPEPQEKEILALKNAGVNADFRLLNASHELETTFFNEIRSWLKSFGY